MTQNEISSAVNAVYILRPSSGNCKEEEYHKQKELFDQASEEFCARVRQAEDHTIFDVLFPLACSRIEPLYGMEAFAAHVLFYLKPVCPISCTDAIRIVSQSKWDASLEEVPWYLANFFGSNMVYQSLTALETENYIKEARAKQETWHASHSHLRTFAEWKEVWKETPPGDAASRLDTVRFWLDIFVGKQGDLLTNWEPLWRWHIKGAGQPAV